MAIPLLYLLGGLGLAGAAAVALAEDETSIPEVAPMKATVVTPYKVGEAASGGIETKTGPLPAGALAAIAAGKSTDANDLHIRGQWFFFQDFSKLWHKKLDKLYFKADPPGSLKVVGKSERLNLLWMARCPADWYPRHGPKSGGHRYCHVKALNIYMSPKADWKAVTSFVKDTVAEIPQIVAAAAVIVGAVYSGGASVTADTEGQLGAVAKALKGTVEKYGDVGKSVKKRKQAGASILNDLLFAANETMVAANPWASVGGKLDISKRYMRNPKTYEDLYKPGNARPLLFNP